jgi:hypothetical protein
MIPDHIYIIVVVRRAHTAKPPVIMAHNAVPEAPLGIFESGVVYGAARRYPYLRVSD